MVLTKLFSFVIILKQKEKKEKDYMSIYIGFVASILHILDLISVIPFHFIELIITTNNLKQNRLTKSYS